MPFITVGERTIGEGNPCFVIAEAGVNHNGDMNLAHQLIDTAADAGADAVKFQTFRADALASPLSPKAKYQEATTETAETQLEMLRRLELSDEQFRLLQHHSHQRGIQFFSSPFDEASADFLESIEVPAFKLPSGEITNLPFIEHVARKSRPIILSTGMSDLDQVKLATEAVFGTGNLQLAVLHCVSAYPANPLDANLKAISTLRRELNLPVGFSDHTPGIEVSSLAVAAGANIIEKHFTIDRSLPGPDHSASLEPAELTRLVTTIRRTEDILGDGKKRPKDAEAEIADVARKSLVAAYDLSAGQTVSGDMIAVRRPGTGISPDQRETILRKELSCDVPAGTPFDLSMFR